MECFENIVIHRSGVRLNNGIAHFNCLLTRSHNSSPLILKL